ncbi:MAG: hypothetical protein KatS3mg102_1361 [Planctomycetota bacterium]|nr:MAG: hypothetical protein KatS3mg102_1361 [Planctomycetota bacterium]
MRLRLLASLACCALVLAVLLAADLWVLTRPELLAARARALLDGAIRTAYSLSAVEASLREGLVLRELIVADASGRPALEVGEVRVGLDPQRFGLGPVRISQPTVWLRPGRHGPLALLELLEPSLLERRGAGGLPRLRIVIEQARLILEGMELYAPGEQLRLEDVSGEVRLDPDDGIEARIAVGDPHWKSLQLTLRAPPAGLPLQVQVEGRKIVVDEGLRPRLPLKQRRLFDRLRPRAVADVDLVLEVQPGERLRPEGVVQVHGGAMQFVGFPYPVTDVTGRIEVRGSHLALRELRGSRGGGTYACEGDIELGPPGTEDYLDLRIEVAALPVDEALARAMPPGVEPLWRRLAPGGRAGGSVRIFGLVRPPGIEDDVHLAVDARLHEGSARFDGFPLPVTELEGGVRVRDDEVSFEGLRGRVAGGRIEVRGRAGPDHVAVWIEGRELRAEARLAAQLLPAHARILRMVRPEGLLDAEIEIAGERPAALVPEEAGARELPVRVQARLHPRPGFTCALRPFPYPLRIEQGQVEIDEQQVRVLGVRARGPAADSPLVVTAAGTIELGPGGEQLQQLALDLELAELPVDATLQQALRELARLEQEEGEPPGPIVRLVRELGLEAGTIQTLVLQLSGGAGAGTEVPLPAATGGSGGEAQRSPFAVQGRAVVRGLVLRPARFPYPFTEVQGALVVSPSALQLEEVRARAGAARLEASGRIALVPAVPPAAGAPPAGEASTARARLEGLLIDEALRAALPPQGRVVLEELGARGRLDATLELRGAPGAFAPRALLRWHGGSMRPRAFPYPIASVAAELLYADGVVQIRELSGRLGRGQLALQGRVRPGELEPPPPGTPAPEEPPLVLRLRASEVALDRNLREALPHGLRRTYAHLDPVGSISVLGHAAFVPERTGGGTLDWNAEVRLVGERLDAGLLLTDLDTTARLYGRARIGGPEAGQPAPGVGPHVRGELAIRRLRWKQQVLEYGRAELRLSPQLFELRDVRGAFLGGLLRGWIYVFLSEPDAYGGHFELTAGRIERWIGGPTDRRGRPLSGRVDGQLWLAGRTGGGTPAAPAPLMGDGQVVIGNARLWQVPIAAGTVFDRAEVRLRLAEGGRVLLDRAELSSPAVSFLGRGEIVDGQARVTMIHELGRVLFDEIPLFGELWRFFKGNLIQLEITGPLDDATVTAVPLPTLVNPFRDLFEGEAGNR